MNKKRLLTWILTVLLAFCAVCFVACDDKPVASELTELVLPTMAQDQMAVIIKNGEKDYTSIVVTLGKGGVDAKTAEDVLTYLQNEGVLSVQWTESDYGKYLTGIGKISPDASKNEFVSVLTSVAKDKGSFAGVTTYKVGDVEIVSSAVGVSEMTVEPGAIIYFEIQTY